MITIKIDGIKALEAKLTGMGKQVPYAASRALNNVAFKLNAAIKDEMKNKFKGGATPFALRSFKVEKANKQNLTAVVGLRRDAPEGGISYDKAFRHIFTGGTREWKKIEGMLRGLGVLPGGLMAVPGDSSLLDTRGNMRKAALAEMIGVIKSGLRNLRVYRKSGGGKVPKALGYFIVPPGAKSHLHPGIWKRIETGKTSVVRPIVMYVKRGHWKQFISLQDLGKKVVSANWKAEFDAELTKAMGGAR